jgi:alkane 1-monooxygenase
VSARGLVVRLGDRSFTARPGDTVLQAALRAGVDFPSGCRVGACGACRCRVAEGEVETLAGTGRRLTAEEKERGVVLACRSVPRSDLRIELRATAPARRGPAARNPAGLLQYLKFSSFHVAGLFSAAALVAGGSFLTAGLLVVLAAYLVGDAVLGDDASTPDYRRPALLTAQLWLAFPLLTLIVFAAVWGVSPGDPLGFGAAVSRLTGHDVLAAREATTPGHRFSAFVLTGLMIGMVGTIPAHELVHRTWDRLSLAVGRALLAFSLDTAFAIEHVHGHHRYVATAEDPATAPRGRNVWAHVVSSTVRGNLGAWRIESERLRRGCRGVLSWHNAFLRGQLASALLVALALAMGGGRAALFFVACALWGKALLEIVNYMEHYGLVRDPGTPVAPRHSWNSNRRVSSWTMFNLTRHSHHHAQGDVPYQDLEPYRDAPRMIGGYLATIVVAMVPPLWHRLMAPRILAWDRHHAAGNERALAAAANARSGRPELR